MIRTFETRDLEQIVKIWLNGNIEAHHFIPKTYWEANLPFLREQLLQAEVYVYEENGILQGFVGMQADYLAGIFVEKHSRCRGVGKQLLHYVKEIHPALTLNVYQKNKRAVEFYQREGFSLLKEGVDKDTGEMEYTMSWNR